MVKSRTTNDGLFPSYDTPTVYNAGEGTLNKGEAFSLYKDPQNPGTYFAGPARQSGKLPKKRADIVSAVSNALKVAFKTYSGAPDASNAKALMEAISIAKKILTPEEFLRAEQKAKMISKDENNLLYTDDDVHELVKDKIEKWSRSDIDNKVNLNSKRFRNFVNEDLIKLRNKLIRDTGVGFYGTSTGGAGVADKNVTEAVTESDAIDTASPTLDAAALTATKYDATNAAKNERAEELLAIVEEFRVQYLAVATKWGGTDKYTTRKAGAISALTRVVVDGAKQRIRHRGGVRRTVHRDGRMSKAEKEYHDVVHPGWRSKKTTGKKVKKTLKACRTGTTRRLVTATRCSKLKSKSKKLKSKAVKKVRFEIPSPSPKKRLSKWNLHIKSFSRAHPNLKGKSLFRAASRTYVKKKSVGGR